MPLRPALSALFCLCAGAALANPAPSEIVATEVIPGFERLAEKADALETVARTDCAPDSTALRDAWSDAFDAWVRVSHLRLGPTETGDRAFALAFWPDTRGFTPKTLATLIADEDPSVETAETFTHVSIAARGFYAMEFLLFDPQFTDAGDYGCALIQAVTRDISDISDAILEDWRTDFSDAFTEAEIGPDGRYRTNDEALQALYTTLTSGLQFTSDTRLGRPLGTFERPRPTRAEAYRSERSLRHVRLSLEATEDLALALAQDAPEKVRTEIADAYDAAFAEVEAQESPVFAGVDTPMGRFKVEVLQQKIDTIRFVISSELGPELGLAAGFNSQDGD